MRVASYNIRNARAIDPTSWWWRRRRRVGDVIADLEADVVCLQEAYPSQIRYLQRGPLASPEWEFVGRGRNARGGGEAVPVFAQAARFTLRDGHTQWFGSTPHDPGTHMTGAAHPRISTSASYDVVGREQAVTIVNLHLDHASADRRGASVDQIVSTLPEVRESLVVLGDFNGPLTESWSEALRGVGFRSVLEDGSGPTANGFGDSSGQQQIDHIFVRDDVTVLDARIVTEAGHASDHYPVVADLEV